MAKDIVFDPKFTRADFERALTKACRTVGEPCDICGFDKARHLDSGMGEAYLACPVVQTFFRPQLRRQRPHGTNRSGR